MENKTNNEQTPLESDVLIAKREAETAPLMDFSVTEDSPDDYGERYKKIKNYYRSCIVGKISQFLFGVFCIVMTTRLGPLGSVVFIAALFYFIPDGLIKGIVYINRYIHATDYVLAKDYHVDNHYLQIVLNRFRKVPYTAKEKD